MRHGHGAAGGDLLHEQRDHAAGGAQDVAEADDGRAHRALAGGVKEHDLRGALRRSHDAGRIDGLVARDEHETLDVVADADLGQVARGQRVVAEILERILFAQRDVLVRRRVQNDLRPRARNQIFQHLGVRDVDEIAGDGRLRPQRFAGEALANFVERIL